MNNEFILLTTDNGHKVFINSYLITGVAICDHWDDKEHLPGITLRHDRSKVEVELNEENIAKLVAARCISDSCSFNYKPEGWVRPTEPEDPFNSIRQQLFGLPITHAPISDDETKN